MTRSSSLIAKKFIWTTVSYIASAGIKFSTNIVLSRLLGPEVLGVMVVAQSVRAGTELLTDVGFEQNVVHSPDGDDEEFLNTIWTAQIIRGLAISLICLALSPLLGSLYGLPAIVFVAMASAPLINSMMSTSLHTLSRHLAVKTRSLFELGVETTGLAINIALAVAMPTIWAPILGVLLTLAARSTASYFLPHPRHKLVLHWKHLLGIIHFGKWIMLSSLALYATLYIDRLFLGRAVDLAVLGVYGLARAIADLPLALVGRLGFQIVFPVISADRQSGAGTARAELAPTRLKFLVLAAFGIATVMAWSDLAASILYDSRYIQAGWMLFLLLWASWLGVLCGLNEAAVFGCGKPNIVSLVNIIRMVVIGVALPTGFAVAGLPGAILALPIAELVRYCALAVAQRRLHVAFLRQDVALTVLMVAILAGWIALRQVLGLGTPWALMPWA